MPSIQTTTMWAGTSRELPAYSACRGCAASCWGLTEQQMVWALGLAASQPVGLRESFGSMNKSFNPGRAASNGLFAAILAAKNFTSSEEDD